MVVEREYWQLLGEDDRGAAHFGSALGQENPELGEQPANAIDGCGAFLDVALAHAMQREDGLLLGALDGNEAHVGPGAAFAGGLGIVTIVPGALATGRNEAGHHDSDSMAMSLELPCPFAGTATGRQADEAWRPVAATSSICWSRRTALRRTVRPLASTPCRENTDFARSSPTVVILSTTSPPASD